MTVGRGYDCGAEVAAVRQRLQLWAEIMAVGRDYGCGAQVTTVG